MHERRQRLEEMGYPPEDAPGRAGLYSQLVTVGSTVYLSGVLPLENGAIKYAGTVPSQVSVDEAADAASLCAANLLRVIERDLGLERVKRIIRVTGFVNSDADFTEQHIVMDGASKLILSIMGEEGNHARSAVGVANLPRGSSVEVELILEI